MTTPTFREAVAAHERALLDRDGMFHVGARYFANETDARTQRRWEAEKLADRERRECEYSFRQQLAAASACVKERLRVGFSHIAYGRAPKHDGASYVANVQKDALSKEKSRCIEQLTALVLHLAERGALADAESVCTELAAAARRCYDAKYGAPANLSEREAHMAEQRAQSEQEEAETAWTHEPTRANGARLLAAQVAYRIAQERYADAVRRTLERGVA